MYRCRKRDQQKDFPFLWKYLNKIQRRYFCGMCPLFVFSLSFSLLVSPSILHQRLRPQRLRAFKKRGGGEISRPFTFNFSFKKKKIWRRFLFQVRFCFGMVDVPSPKIVTNLPWNYKKLHCNGETYRCSGQRDLNYIQTYRHPDTLI